MTKKSAKNGKKEVNPIIGPVCAFLVTAAGVATIHPDWTMEWPTLLLLIVLVHGLMHGADSATELAAILRGGDRGGGG